ncbi:MAG: hypothetical protein IIA70_06555 [Proteobacteria bacterium]|nr:hypothetical protein [Pseudomonadota bacterium]
MHRSRKDCFHKENPEKSAGKVIFETICRHFVIKFQFGLDKNGVFGHFRRAFAGSQEDFQYEHFIALSSACGYVMLGRGKNENNRIF